MVSKKLAEAINQHINAEFWSAYLYLSMSAYFASNGKPGFAKWFHAQFQEEQEHAMKLFNYLVSMDIAPVLLPIEKVETVWDSPLAVFENTLKHEKKVTALINDLYSIAAEDKDYASQSMLQWFINEQVEEEDNVRSIIDALAMIGGNGFGLYTLDKELAARIFTPAATASKP